MVGQLTYGKRQWESLDGEMRRLIPSMGRASREMTDMIDADTDAFNDYMVRGFEHIMPVLLNVLINTKSGHLLKPFVKRSYHPAIPVHTIQFRQLRQLPEIPCLNSPTWICHGPGQASPACM
jgi:hypothetical protein